MSDAALLARLQAVEATVARLTARVAVLEGGAATVEEPPLAPEEGPVPTAARVAEDLLAGGVVGNPLLAGVPALVGRSCLALGGAFLIRSLAEQGTLSGGMAVAVGVLYALVWLIFADRAAARGAALSGAFHALVTALVVYPLLVEATARFHLLAPRAAVALLALATGLGLVVAWRRAFRTIAWISLLSALAAAIALMVATRAFVESVVLLLALAVASMLLAWGRGWRGQRWMVALVVDAVVLVLGAFLTIGRAAPPWLPPSAVLLAQLGLVVVYLGGLGLRLLAHRRPLTGFAIVQTALVLAVGFELSVPALGASGRSALGVACVAAAAGLALVLVRRRADQTFDASAAAWALVVAAFACAEGLRLLLPAAVYPGLWALASLLLAMLVRFARPLAVPLLAALGGVAAAVASGLVGVALRQLLAPLTAGQALPATGGGALVVIALATALAWRLERHPTVAAAVESRALALVCSTLLAVVVVAVGGAIVGLGASFLASAASAAPSPGTLAALRSVVLAASAVVLAIGAARRRYAGQRWLARLAWLLLLVAGGKLLLEDLRVAGAGALVISLLAYGSALIAVPALTRRARPSDGEAPAELA